MLTITAGSGFYDEELTASLARPMPELQELQLVDVAFERVILTEVRVRANPNPHPDPNPNPNPDPDPNPHLTVPLTLTLTLPLPLTSTALSMSIPWNLYR